jgi:Protein of unknown function (DUF3887)
MRLTAAAQAIAVAAALLALTACGSDTSATSSSTTAAAGKYDDQALQILDSVVKQDFKSATTHFDSTMQEKLSPQALGSAWDQYQAQFGKYESHGNPEDVPRGELTVVNIPLKMATEPGEFRATFHDGDGTVAGLFFLRTGVPVP